MLFTNKTGLLVPRDIKLSFGTLAALVGGEEGRGRRLLVLPVDSVLLKKTQEAEGYIPLNSQEISIGTTTTGRPKIIASGDSNANYALLSTAGGHTRRGCGYNTILEWDAEILASGNGADGEAGGIGTWDIDLFELKSSNGIIKIKYSGGKEPAYFIWNDSKFTDIPKDEIQAYYESLAQYLPACLEKDM